MGHPLLAIQIAEPRARHAAGKAEAASLVLTAPLVAAPHFKDMQFYTDAHPGTKRKY